MDWGYKAMLTATLVALLLTVAQLFGRRVAGVLAGLPTVTGPALLWLALENDAGYAVEAAAGSVVGCALCALFAFAYERCSRRSNALVAGLAATAISMAAMPLAGRLDAGLPLALAAALAVVMLLYVVMPTGAVQARGRIGMRGEPFVTASVAGVVSGAVALAAPEVGAFWAGVLASPPLIAGLVAMQQHATDGPHAAAAFLRGYVGGLVGRIGFGGAFAVLLLVLPVPVAALLAFAAGCLFSLAGMRLLGRRAVPLASPAQARR
jgi:hypothetical protein